MTKAIDEEELAKLIGPANAAEFARRATEAELKFNNLIDEASAKIVEETRKDFEQFVSNPEVAQHRVVLMNAMRLTVLDGISCILLSYSAEFAAELKTGYGEFAHHLLDHLTTAYQSKSARMLKSSLGSILDGLIPPDVKERLKATEESPEG